jgi:hypothetical protein
MNEAEFFRRAREDSSFRYEHLENRRYYRNINLGLLVFWIILGTGLTLYCGLTGGGWIPYLGILPLLNILLSVYWHRRNARICAELEAMSPCEPI